MMLADVPKGADSHEAHDARRRGPKGEGAGAAAPDVKMLVAVCLQGPVLMLTLVMLAPVNVQGPTLMLMMLALDVCCTGPRLPFFILVVLAAAIVGLVQGALQGFSRSRVSASKIQASCNTERTSCSARSACSRTLAGTCEMCSGPKAP